MSLNFPVDPSDGDLYEGYIFDDTAGVWNSNPAQIASRFVTSASAPENPSEGDGWFDSTTAKSYTYYDGVWVQIGAPGAIRFNQLEGIEVTDPLDGEIIVYDSASSQWVNESPITTFGGLEDTNIDTPATGDSLVYDGSDWVNGPRSHNAIINGDFGIWQRGTSFASQGAVAAAFSADRYHFYRTGGGTGATLSRQSGTGEFFYSARIQRDSGTTGTSAIVLRQTLETSDSVQFRGKQISFSFYARAGANFSSSASNLTASVATGTGVDQPIYSFTGFTTVVSQTRTLTTSWQRFSVSGTVGASISGIGFEIFYTPTGTAGADDWFEITGIQLEAGPVATPFNLAGGGSKAAELALCQRYYYRTEPGALKFLAPGGYIVSTTSGLALGDFPVTMRIAPTSLEQSGTAGNYEVAHSGTLTTCSAVPTFVSYTTQNVFAVQFFVASGLTVGRSLGFATSSSGANAFLAWSAEL